MKASLLLVAVLSGPLLVHAADPVGPARITRESADPIDNMPIIGDQTPILKQRLQNLEERLRQAETAQGSTTASPSADGSQRLPDSAPSGDWLRRLEERIKELESQTQKRSYASPTTGSAEPSDLYVQVYTLAQNGEKAAARADYETARQSYEKSRELLASLQKSFPHWQAPMVDYRKQKIVAALENLKTKSVAGNEEATKQLIEGIGHYQAERFDEAVNALTKSLALNPRSARGHLWLSRTAAKKGWTDAAEKELETALRLDPALETSKEVGPPAALPSQRGADQIPPPPVD